MFFCLIIFSSVINNCFFVCLVQWIYNLQALGSSLAPMGGLSNLCVTGSTCIWLHDKYLIHSSCIWWIHPVFHPSWKTAFQPCWKSCEWGVNGTVNKSGRIVNAANSTRARSSPLDRGSNGSGSPTVTVTENSEHNQGPALLASRLVLLLITRH